MNLAHVREVDVVVVGGGPAGLAAASALADLPDVDVLLLEEQHRLGGRLRSSSRGSVWLNYGAHIFPGGCCELSRLASAVGVELVPVPGVRTALWFEGTLHGRRRVESYALALPLSLRERLDFVRVGLKVWLGVAAARRRSRPRSDRTLGGWLTGVAPRVRGIFETAARRSAGEADRLTEAGALALFGALWTSGGSSSTIVAGGSGRLGDALARRLGDHAMTGARVESVIEHEDHVLVTFRDADGAVHDVRAGRVVVAIPAPLVPAVVTDLPAEVVADLRSVTYGAFVCLSVLTNDLPPAPWDGLYAIAAPGAEFDMLFHHSNPLVQGLRGTRPRSLMCYVGGDRAAALLDAPDHEIERRFLAQVREVLPEIGNTVAEATVTKWRQGNCYPTTTTSVAHVETWNQRHGGRVLLAGDYFAPGGGTAEAAALSGAAASRSTVLPRRRHHLAGFDHIAGTGNDHD